MRTIVILSLLLACSSPHSAAPRKYGSFLGPGFVQRPDTLAALSAKAAAGDTVQWDGSKWGAVRRFGWTVGEWSAQPSSTSINTYGSMAAPTTSSGGTLTTRSQDTSSFATSLPRVGIVSSGAGTGVATLRGSGTGPKAWRGNAAGLGGFYFAARFLVSDAALVSTANMFVGLDGGMAIGSDVTPSTQTSILGFGCSNGDTTLHVYASGSVAQTPQDLGSKFPVNTTDTDVYEVVLFAKPDDTQVSWTVTRLNTGDTASGTITDSAKLPSVTTQLFPYLMRSEGGTASAVGIDVQSVLLDSG